MRFLYENQNLDFDDVRSAIARMHGPDCTVTIHDGDGIASETGVPAYFCAGTITNAFGTDVATFAIDYVVEHTEDDEEVGRHVTAIHIGAPGQWCRSLSQMDDYTNWERKLARFQAPESRRLSKVHQ